ncbi:hypothetical protein AM629_18085 [Photorhabdus heterorhabditis]|uniref:FidL-like membrane protein n=1 Tax=Photorhabdus heterorhabditis TaxID=880156 RepID=A0ABR5K7V1_9GAMM|nr:hypothetical protein [Photorhabdus heterorhabditis]KOY60677.1 hypothetical protein AM629_18085 [Photorhabdus heterorhabditis]
MIKKAFFVVVAVLLLVPPVIVKKLHDSINKFNNLPFKCQTFTRYVLDDNGRTVYINVALDLRLYSSKRGYFLLTGTVQDKEKTSRLSRTIRLENGYLTQGKTFAYQIKSIEKLDSDNSDDSIFQRLLNEYRTGSREFQIDVFRIDKLTWLVGGPYAFVNTCTRY